MKSGIYKITSPSSKIYIGQSIDIDSRIKAHKHSVMSKNKTKLISSFKKYGIDNHIFEIILLCDISKLNYYERYYQDLYDCVNSGLNLKLQSTSELKQVHSYETKKKIGATLKGKMVGDKNPMFGKFGELNPMFGKRHSDELIEQIRLKNIGRSSGEKNPMFGIRLTGDKNPFYGKKHPDNMKKMLSKNNYKRRDILDLETGIFYSTLTELGDLFSKNKWWACDFIKKTKRYIYT